MKIVELKAENVKRLSAVSIKPDGSVVVVGGRNEQGKSSLLDSIMYGLAGTDSIPAKPLRNGAAKGHVSIDCGEFTVTRKFTRKKDGDDVSTSLEIKRANGDKVTSPQAMLDELCGRIAFDPLEFARLKPKQQLEALKELVGLDFTDADKERKSIYDRRTSINQQLKAKQAELAACPKIADAPDSEVSVAELAEELEGMEEVNRNNAGERQLNAALKLAVDTARAEVARLEAALAAAKETADQHHDDWSASNRKVDSLKDQDTTEIRERIKSADDTNRAVRQNIKHFGLTHDVANLQAETDSLSASIEEIDAHKKSQLAAAKFPINGMSFTDDGVLLDGLPLEQASSRGRIRTSVAMGLALNPKLRVMLIREGSLLDEEGLAMVSEMAEQADAQIWIERVSVGEECSVIIEDGHLAEARELVA